MHAARWRLAERLDDRAGAAWTLEPDNRRAAGLAARPAPTALLAGRQ